MDSFPADSVAARLALAERVQYIFERCQPEALEKLPRMMQKNAGDEGKLYANLCRKYSLDDSFFPAGQLPLEALGECVLKLRIEMIVSRKNPVSIFGTHSGVFNEKIVLSFFKMQKKS